MTHINDLIAAINKINKDIEEVENNEINVANIKEYEEAEAEREALYRKLSFAAEDLAKAAQLVSRNI